MKRFFRWFFPKEMSLAGKLATLWFICWMAGLGLLLTAVLVDSELNTIPSIVLALVALVFLAIGVLSLAVVLPVLALAKWLKRRMRRRRLMAAYLSAPSGAGKEGRAMAEPEGKKKGGGGGIASVILSSVAVALAAVALVLSVCISGPPGPEGPAGPTGPQGPRGDSDVVSAEDLAADSTFVATVAAEVAKIAKPPAKPAPAPRPKPRTIWD